MTQMNSISVVSSTRTRTLTPINVRALKYPQIWEFQDKNPAHRELASGPMSSLVHVEATAASSVQGPGHLPTPQSDISPNASPTLFTCPSGAH